MGGCIDRWVDVETDRWMYRQMGGCMDRWVDV